MKKTLLSLAMAMLVMSCSNNEKLNNLEENQQELLTRSEINTIITNAIEADGDFIWKDSNANTIYSAAKLSDGILSIGYGVNSEDFSRTDGSNDLKSEILALINSYESVENAKENRELFADDILNVVDVKIENIATVEALLKDSRVRYVEPANYSFFKDNKVQERSSSGDGSGCGFDSSTLSGSDYTTVAPAARVPWSFYKHNIPAAWSHSTGAGITVAIIDTGLSGNQGLMNQYFNSGYSSGRSVQRYGYFVDSWWPWSSGTDGVNDKCGHGTSMSAVATAPRNNANMPVGVAYNASLVAYRAAKNVVLDSYHEQNGVSNAIKAAANRSDVRVISMSLGHIFSVGKISDAVKYAYNKGKMVLAAGGTSTSFTNGFGVIFPANMSQTVAVTGVKENQTTSRCDVCHSGSKIDFTVQMQRSNGKTVPVLGYYNNQSDYVGGSSIATATTAGIAALVWSKHPTWTRSQVLAKMKQSAEFYPSKNSDYGYGNIDALQAVQ